MKIVYNLVISNDYGVAIKLGLVNYKGRDYTLQSTKRRPGDRSKYLL